MVALDKTQPKIDRIQINLARFHLSCVQLYKCDGRQTLSMESKALPHLGDNGCYDYTMYIVYHCVSQVILLHMDHAHLTGYLLMPLVVDLVAAHSSNVL